MSSGFVNLETDHWINRDRIISVKRISEPPNAIKVKLIDGPTLIFEYPTINERDKAIDLILNNKWPTGDLLEEALKQ